MALKNKANKIYLIILALSSILTHFLFWGHPNEIVFDEVHFGKFISGYFTHQYFFDIHPPLGKLLISAVGYLSGFKPGFSFAEIGQKFADSSYLWLRFLPMLAGTILPIIIFLLVLELGLSSIAAFSAGAFVVLENSLLVQSRFILLDSFLLLFGFAALLLYFVYDRNRYDTKYLFLSGILATMSLSVKWTGAVFLASIIIIGAVKGVENRQVIKLRNYILTHVIYLIVIPVLLYFAIFAVHLKLLYKTGQGDAFMAPSFQKTLLGNPNASNTAIKPLNIVQKFVELNIEMYKSNQTLTMTHPYSSKWYTWPFMIRPIYYWYGAPESSTLNTASRIYFMGNSIIWWASTVAILFLILETLSMLYTNGRKKIAETWRKNNLRFFLAGSFFLNLLPFIGITRVMFLYHYMVALIFSVITLVFLIDRAENKNKIFIGLLATGLVAFIFFSPLSYGLPLTENAYNMRVWLSSWK